MARIEGVDPNVVSGNGNVFQTEGDAAAESAAAGKNGPAENTVRSTPTKYTSELGAADGDVSGNPTGGADNNPYGLSILPAGVDTSNWTAEDWYKWRKSLQGGSGSSAPADYELTMPEGKSDAELARQRAELSAALNAAAPSADIQKVGKYDKQPMVDLATQQIEAARQQYNGQINRSMDQNAVELTRALADAQRQYQTQQNQVTAEEMNARDNAALYAEARGDKGGIGQAQYTNIVNNAAQNRTTVRQAQSKMANDTARQISSLRAQGEFDKADKMLELTQSYLSELRQIEEYATNYNLSVDQINTAIQEWEAEYNRAAQQYATSTELSLANLTGRFSNGTPTYEAQQNTEAQLAKIALSLIDAGVRPDKLSDAQLLALQSQYGMDADSIKAYAAKVQ